MNDVYYSTKKGTRRTTKMNNTQIDANFRRVIHALRFYDANFNMPSISAPARLTGTANVM
eukprot:768456-Hanusia_phi.AAC.11